MKRILRCHIFAIALLPLPAAAQQGLVERLQDVLPEDVAAAVIQRIEDARVRELPVQAAANLVGRAHV